MAARSIRALGAAALTTFALTACTGQDVQSASASAPASSTPGSVKTAPAKTAPVKVVAKKADPAPSGTKKAPATQGPTMQGPARIPSAALPPLGAPGQTIRDGSYTLDGIGTVKPSYVQLGWHNGLQLSKLVWSGYGGATATAHGYANAPEPGQAWVTATPHKMTVKAKLGTCNGRPAYTTLSWTFDGYSAKDNADMSSGVFDLCHLGY